MYKKQWLFIFLMIITASTAMSQLNEKPFVIPSLQKWEGGKGQFRLQKSASIVYTESDSGTRKAAAILQADLTEAGYGSFKMQPGNSRTGDIVFTLLPVYDTGTGEEGYYFDVSDKIVISANTYRGLFWGSRTLLQLLEQNKGGIPKGRATDYPKYAVRGFMLDVGRKFFSLEFLKRYVKLMAYYKMSDFQIHLNDNGFKKYFNNNWDSTYSGFRLESDTYPNLPTKGEYYTKNEFRDLQKMAQDYGVKIIPEIDVPAHSLAFTHAMPELGSKKYGMDHLDINNPKTYEVIENVFKEYLSGPDPVFAGDEVHIGTDEYDKSEAESFRKFTDHFIRYVQGFGKKVRAWGALTHATGNTPVTAKDVTLNIWYNGYAHPVEMKKLGYKLISTPDGYLYIVPAAGYYYDYLNLPFLFRKWTPLQIGNVKFEEGDSSVVGGMFAVWNDVVGNGITAMDVHDRVLPALKVLSEKMWSNVTDTLNYSDFAGKARYIGEGPGLNMLGAIGGNDSSDIILNAASGVFESGGKALTGKLKFSNIKKNTRGGAYANQLSFRRNNSFIETPIEHIGYPYRIAFDLYPKPSSRNRVLFSDPVWNTSVELLPDGQLAFFRENYKDTFNCKIPDGRWSSLELSGDRKSVSLHINGQLIQKLEGFKIPINEKETMFRVQTLVFPLKQIGSPSGGVRGSIANIRIYRLPGK